MKIIGLIIYTKKAIDRIYMYMCRSSFSSIGKNVIFHPTNSSFSFKTISIGNNVAIGEKAFFNATLSHIYIANNVIFAPNVTIRGGNHRYDIIGKFISDYHESDKRPEDDEPVHIESDCWIASNVIILKGVTIGRGSIVAAGAVGNKSIPPYSIVGGVPAKVLKFRWNTVEEIMKHEELLYPENERISRVEIEKFLKKYARK